MRPIEKFIPIVKCSLLPATAHLSSAHLTFTETEKGRTTLCKGKSSVTVVK